MNDNEKLTKKKNGKKKILPILDESTMTRIPLERSSYSAQQYYVLPAGGMHFPIPNLDFNPNHFKEDLSPVVKISDRQMQRLHQAAGMKSSVDEAKESKLPLGVSLTAGVGCNKSENDSGAKSKTPLPSDTLMASAAFLKSYFTPNQEADETVKNKMLGLWHNMKYGWSSSIKTEFSKETPIYLLGKIYHKSFSDNEAYNGSGFACSNLEAFKKDFLSLPWFTYRRKFPPLPQSALTSDCGWGCMIRSGQMMMATALTRHFLPPGWRYNNENDDEDPQMFIHRQIMKWFCDIFSTKHPFSLHNLVSFGHKMNKKAGNWYGPSCVAHMIKEALIEGRKEFPSLDYISVYVAQDGAVYLQDVFEMCYAGKCICCKSLPPTMKTRSTSCGTADRRSCQSDSSSFCDIVNEEINFNLDLFVDSNRDRQTSNLVPISKVACSFCHEWRSCLILIPVRLGGSSINPIYREIIYNLLLHDLCVGIIGGKPKHSLYFVGFQEDSLIHLDPHLSQDAVDLDDRDFSLKSFHCSSPRKIPISKMDPSATIGFYCPTIEQFYRLQEEVSKIATARDGSLDSPVFEFLEGKMTDLNGWLSEELEEEEKTRNQDSFLDSEILRLD